MGAQGCKEQRSPRSELSRDDSRGSRRKTGSKDKPTGAHLGCQGNAEMGLEPTGRLTGR